MTNEPNLSDAGAVRASFDDATRTLRESPARRGCVDVLPTQGRLLATGDLHDNPFHFEKIVRYARLDDGPDRHVVLHELIHGENLVNGIDFSYRMLARVAMLVVRHPGQVHPVLANHELAQMTGKGVSKGAGNSVELFRDGLEYVFGDEAVEVEEAINDFVRAMALAVVSAGGVLCAHSLPGPGTMARFDPGVLDRELVDEDYMAPGGAAYLMTWGRGAEEPQVAQLAERWNVRLFCLGHDHVDTGIEARGAYVVILNSDHARATVLPLDLAELPTPEEALMHAMPLASL